MVINESANKIFEASSLLWRLKMKDTFAQEEAAFLAKTGLNEDDVLKKFDLLKRIEKEAREHVSPIIEDLDYYFSVDSGQVAPLGCGSILLFEPTGYDYSTIESLREYLYSLSDEQWLGHYGDAVGFCLNKMHIDDDMESDFSFASIEDAVRKIISLPISNELKIKFQSVLVDRKSHWEKIFKLLEWAMSIIEPFEDEMNAWVKKAAQYERKLLGDGKIYEYMSKLVGIEMDYNEQGYEVTIGVIMYNMVNVFVDAILKPKTKAYLRLGVIFDEYFEPIDLFMVNSSANPERIEKVLKLLADKSKFAILLYIKDNKAYGSELAKHFNLTTATISHHMSALVSDGLVKTQEIDNKVYYSTNKEALRSVFVECTKMFE